MLKFISFFQVESEIMQLEKAERKIFLDDLGVSGSGLESLVSSALLLYLSLNIQCS